VIFREWLKLKAMILVMAGANSFAEESAPASEGAPSAVVEMVAGDDDRSAILPRLVWKVPADHQERVAVEVIGADPAAVRSLARSDLTIDRWNSFLVVRVVPPSEPTASDQPPLWGSYRVASDVIRFEPRFPLEPGLRYRAEFDLIRLNAVVRAIDSGIDQAASQPRSTSRLVAEYSAPTKPARATTRVAAVYPSRDLLPENLLHFYISFSAPMSRGEAYQRISLIDAATGKKVEAPFLELDEELWSPDGTRFTLIFDPGRIKRGLRPREEVGPVLEAGKLYSLVIDRQWLDASRNLLEAGFRKTFRVGPPDDVSPDPKTWTIDAPRAGTRDGLVVRFPESLDRALLERLIWVENADSKVVTGQSAAGTAETSWRFTPASPWGQGAYRLVVGTELEDLAGNSVAQPFEVDGTGPISRRITSKTVVLPFQTGALAP
jgi:hypothetical protein